MFANWTAARRQAAARPTPRFAAAALTALTVACSNAPDQRPAAPPAAEPAQAAAPVAAASTAGTVTGKLASAGAAVVVLESKTPRAFPEQTEKPVMDQVGLTFGPELLIVRTGQPVEFRNSDDTLHNVNVKNEETREQAFNVAIPTGASYEHTFARDGFYRVGCDIHPAMAASIFAASTPFATAANADGTFTFNDVPAGAWTVVAYTGGKRLEAAIDVKGGVTQVTVE